MTLAGMVWPWSVCHVAQGFMLDGRENRVVLHIQLRHPMTTLYTPQDETPVPPEGHYISV